MWNKPSPSTFAQSGRKRSTFNIQCREGLRVQRWALKVGRWAFVFVFHCRVTVFLDCAFAAKYREGGGNFSGPLPYRSSAADMAARSSDPWTRLHWRRQPSEESPRGKALSFPFLTQLNFCYFSGFMASPEELAREKIDKLLTECGWTIQNRSTINLNAARGVAIREALLKDRDEVDYLLFVDGKANAPIAKSGINRSVIPPKTMRIPGKQRENADSQRVNETPATVGKGSWQEIVFRQQSAHAREIRETRVRGQN
jgi:hypothetical protein